uniref:Uncharacterized protein n=1 Tax=Peronospora matthiolae TaxID=2874970 RepID=A0AAV1UW06_9STRA
MLISTDASLLKTIVNMCRDCAEVHRTLWKRVKSKGKDETHTFERSDVTIQWQVADESGLPCVLQRVQSGSDGAESWGRNTAVGSVEATGKYRPLPVRQLVVAVWMYLPHVEVALTEERTPVSDVVKQDFFAEMDRTMTAWMRICSKIVVTRADWCPTCCVDGWLAGG